MTIGPARPGELWAAGDRAANTLPAEPTRADASSPVERLRTTLLGKYRIEKLLGEGGCGRVYLATHLQLRSQVAIKFLLSQWQNRSISRQRFRREARALALLSHPSIVGIHDFGEDAGELYLVMEYVRGVPLSELILRNGEPLPPARAVAIIDSLLEVLTVAHERGIVHRDRFTPEPCVEESARTAALESSGREPRRVRLQHADSRASRSRGRGTGPQRRQRVPKRRGAPAHTARLSFSRARPKAHWPAAVPSCRVPARSC